MNLQAAVERKQLSRSVVMRRSLLSRERSRNEVTWSAGSRMESTTVAAAFKLPEHKQAVMSRGDAKPISALGCLTVIIIVGVLILLLLLLSQCSSSSSSSSSSRSSGGSWGGSSSGGGHK